MNLLKTLWIGTLPALFWPQPGRAVDHGPRAIVVVFSPQPKGIDLPAELTDRLADLVANRLVANGAYRVVPRMELHRLLRAEQNRSYGDCYDTSCQVALGRELAADHSLAGRVLRLGDGCTVALELYDLASATAVRAASADGGCEPQALAGLTRQAVDRLSGPAEAAPSPDLSAAVDTPLDGPRERGWFFEVGAAYGYSRFADLERGDDMGGFVLGLTAGHRFGFITPELFGLLALGEGSYLMEDGSYGRAFVSGGGLMGGASALWAPGWLELEVGLHMGFAAVDPPGWSATNWASGWTWATCTAWTTGIC